MGIDSRVEHSFRNYHNILAPPCLVLDITQIWGCFTKSFYYAKYVTTLFNFVLKRGAKSQRNRECQKSSKSLQRFISGQFQGSLRSA